MKCLFQNISHGLIDSLIRYSVFKVQTAFMLRKHFVRLKQFGVGLISFAYFVTGIRPAFPAPVRLICASTFVFRAMKATSHCFRGD